MADPVSLSRNQFTHQITIESADEYNASPTGDFELRCDLVPPKLDQLYTGDWPELFPKPAAETIDLVFANPPFNTRYDYDIYEDCHDAEAYLKWSLAWGREVVAVLKVTGAFRLAIGEEFAAELKV